MAAVGPNTRRVLLLGFGSLTLMAALTGAVWVPLLVSRVNQLDAELESSKKAVQRRDEEALELSRRIDELQLAAAEVDPNHFASETTSETSRRAVELFRLAQRQRLLDQQQRLQYERSQAEKIAELQRQADASLTVRRPNTADSDPIAKKEPAGSAGTSDAAAETRNDAGHGQVENLSESEEPKLEKVPPLDPSKKTPATAVRTKVVAETADYDDTGWTSLRPAR